MTDDDLEVIKEVADLPGYVEPHQRTASSLPVAEVITPEYTPVDFSGDEMELYGDALMNLVMMGLELHKYMPAKDEVSATDYTGKQKDIVNVFNAALFMRQLLDAQLAKAGVQGVPT